MSRDQFLAGMGESTQDMGIDANPLLQSTQTPAEGTQLDETLSDPQQISICGSGLNSSSR